MLFLEQILEALSMESRGDKSEKPDLVLQKLPKS